MMPLAEFRTELTSLMQSEHERPFVCSGSPIACSVFLVGFNPATHLDKPFWSIWSDHKGFDRIAFMTEYERTREVRGVRLRLNEMVRQFPDGSVLETNICAQPTRKAAQLKQKDRRAEILHFLLRSVQPRVIFLHSNEPINYFATLMDDPLLELPDHAPVRAGLLGTTVTICVSRGPLWRRKTVDMADLASRLASSLK